MSQLDSGLGQLSSKSPELVGGVNQLYTGVEPTLAVFLSSMLVLINFHLVLVLIQTEWEILQ